MRSITLPHPRAGRRQLHRTAGAGGTLGRSVDELARLLLTNETLEREEVELVLSSARSKQGLEARSGPAGESSQPAEPTSREMSAETMKMPEPIMLPATSMVASNSPRRC